MYTNCIEDISERKESFCDSELFIIQHPSPLCTPKHLRYQLICWQSSKKIKEEEILKQCCRAGYEKRDNKKTIMSPFPLPWKSWTL
jgi:hypothetical protein